MANKRSIVIVDDHPFVREGLKQLLAGQSEFHLTGEASSVGDARASNRRSEPDVAVRGPRAWAPTTASSWCAGSARTHPSVRVLVLSMQDEALYAERLLRLGVSGYVMKNVAGTDFLGALRKVARGQRHVSAAMGERLLRRWPGARRGTTMPVSALTNAKLEVFA